MARATIRDVAERAGVSVATVSLVLNNKNVSLSQKTKEKVRQVIQELNYTPNQLAVGLITKKTKVLGLIIPDNCNDFFASLSKDIELATRQYGYGVIYGNTNNDSQRDLEYMKMFRDRQVDGIILVKSASQEEIEEKALSFIQKSSIPVITIDRKLQDSKVRAVMLNHFKGGYLATRHLLKLGHTRIGAYTGPHSLPSSNERLEGYRSALAEANIPFDNELVFEGNYQMGLESEAMRHLLNKRVSAIFCFNDLMAAGLYREARSLGLSIPDDLSVVGFDNVSFSEIIYPPLTTIGQPVRQMSECAVKTLIDIINQGQPEDPRSVYLFEPKLIVRESTQQFVTKG